MPNLHENRKEKGKNEEPKSKPKKQKSGDKAILRSPQPEDEGAFLNGSEKSDSSDVILISASSPSSSDSELPRIALKSGSTSRDNSEKAAQSKSKTAKKSTALGTGMASSNVAKALKTRKSTPLGGSGKAGMLSSKGGMSSAKAARKSMMPAMDVSPNKAAGQKGGATGSNTNPIVVDDDGGASSTDRSLTANPKKRIPPKKHLMTSHHDKDMPPKRRKKHLSSDASMSTDSSDIELRGSSLTASASASRLTESAKVSVKGPNKLVKKQSIAKFAQGKSPKNTALESPRTMATHKPATSKKLDSKKLESETNSRLSTSNKRSSLPIQNKSFGKSLLSSDPPPGNKSGLSTNLKNPKSPVNSQVVPPHMAFPSATKMKSPSLSPPPLTSSQRLGSSSPPHKVLFPVRTRSPSFTSQPPPPPTLYKLGSPISRRHSTSLTSLKSLPPSGLPSVPTATMSPSQHQKLLIFAAKNKLLPTTQRPPTTFSFSSSAQQSSCSSEPASIAAIKMPLLAEPPDMLGNVSVSRIANRQSSSVRQITKTPLLAEPPDMLRNMSVSRNEKCQAPSVQQKNLHSSKTDSTLSVPQPTVKKKSKVDLESSQFSVDSRSLSEYSTPGTSPPSIPGQSLESCATNIGAGGTSVSQSGHLGGQFEDMAEAVSGFSTNSTSDWSSVASDTETISNTSSGGPLFSSPRLVHKPVLKKRRQTARKSTGGFFRMKVTPSRKFYLKINKIKVRLKDSSTRSSESSQLPQQKKAKNPLAPKKERFSLYSLTASQSTFPHTRKRKLSKSSSTLSVCSDVNSTNTPKRTKFQPGGETSKTAVSNVGSNAGITMVTKKSKPSDQLSTDLAVAPSQATSLPDNQATTKLTPEDLATTKPKPSSSDLCSSGSTARPLSSDSDSTTRPSVPAVSTGVGSYSSANVATNLLAPLDSNQPIVPSERDRELDKLTDLATEISEESDFNPNDCCEIDSEMETTCARTTPFGCYPVLSESLGSCARTRPFCSNSFAVDSTATSIHTPVIIQSPTPSGFSSDFQLQMDSASSSSPSDSESGVNTTPKRLLSAPLGTNEGGKKQTISPGLIQSNDKTNSNISEFENSDKTVKESTVTPATLPAKEQAAEKQTTKEPTAEEPTAEKQTVEEVTAKDQKTDMELTVNGQTAVKLTAEKATAEEQTSQESTAEEQTAIEKALVPEANNTHDDQMVLTSDATCLRKDNDQKQKTTKNDSAPPLNTSEEKTQRQTQRDTSRVNRFRLPLLLQHPKISLINNTSERSLRDNYTSSPDSSSSFVSAHSTFRSEQCSSRFYSPLSTPSSASFMTAHSTPVSEDEFKTPRPVQFPPISEEETKTPRLMSPQEEEYKQRLQDTIAKLACGDSEVNEPLLSPSSR